MNLTIETMKNHKSIRKYKDTMIDDEIIEVLLEVARKAPTSLNGQQRSIVVVKDRKRKEKIEKNAY